MKLIYTPFKLPKVLKEEIREAISPSYWKWIPSRGHIKAIQTILKGLKRNQKRKR